jgi:hypothetical protein
MQIRRRRPPLRQPANQPFCFILVGWLALVIKRASKGGREGMDNCFLSFLLLL